MKIVLSAAVTVDGSIADRNGETNWVLDWDLYQQTCKEYGCVVMGWRTYEEGDSVFAGVQHLVLSSKKGGEGSEVHFVASPEEAVQKAEELGFDKMLLIGGAKANQSFAEAGLIDEMIIDLHPLALGYGKKLLDEFNGELKLEQASSEEHKEGFTRIRYKVLK